MDNTRTRPIVVDYSFTPDFLSFFSPWQYATNKSSKRNPAAMVTDLGWSGTSPPVYTDGSGFAGRPNDSADRKFELVGVVLLLHIWGKVPYVEGRII
jgi:hypothetical protein